MNINQYGLISDILGVFTLFKYGLPSEIIVLKPDVLVLSGRIDPIEQKSANKRNRFIKAMSYLALGLLSIGFLLQFIGSFSQPSVQCPHTGVATPQIQH